VISRRWGIHNGAKNNTNAGVFLRDFRPI